MKRDKELNLSNRNLSYIPAEIFDEEWLEILNLSSNKLIAVPSGIGKLRNLTSLNLSNNQLNNLPDFLVKLQSLRVLDLSYNQLEVLPDWLAELKNLHSLILGKNFIRSIPNSIFQLKSLTKLDLYGNQIERIDDSIRNLSGLRELILSNNELADLPKGMGELKLLNKIILNNNCFDEIPDSVFDIRELNIIEINNWNESGNRNQIFKISPKILQLENLKKLDLAGNPVEVPPPEIVNKGLEAIKEYFREIEANGEDYLFEAKFLIIGEGGVGKTSLAKKIQNPDYQLREDEASTEGIDVLYWDFLMGGWKDVSGEYLGFWWTGDLSYNAPVFLD